MYLINVKINPQTKINDEKINAHRQWFKSFYDQQKFLIVGPSKSVPMSGIIVAQAKDRNELDKIISQDVFYPREASYEVNEFQAKLVSSDIKPDQD
ncbi:YciI family protein [Limosilactobacillus fastidiosus]|uniref:YCII-related domain-containing protein n=1 Tax=Limosilactobacillus fastidiosus TaxID=2759855 RepID=A0A7W3TZJ4_9LACO|nr:YciI family protein [Limosilactobacillus fastidiosus]MBB1062959.1 hypothetical protein [Limosilactobacillus fastidiosus]MBB1086199.1 hypothetical protein [Limosilactobacillus fastidiosus]MCD7084564.1 YciI family protein [Limosilactobacillus fastidiosus]MCD7086530.1 YciI family protein [Limosilactobacillus fastidiosus]MCD7114971.1 YciI family protein [Limosilactobacillus fastidiosus]